ncbi:hypothetical protein HB847_15775 [Listeria booriae]|uniref:Uncharacterized protein n=1 Tax=Listeria booriae TaxID=1552123 RepID=A0A841YA68_9LIST|nr:hypothetical protein [Listeria booriae]MBC1373811.1 hypothetical protein [Listeria booriae]
MGLLSIFQGEQQPQQTYFVSFVYGSPPAFGHIHITLQIAKEPTSLITPATITSIQQTLMGSYKQAVILNIIPLGEDGGA